jgi:peptide deformylase
MAKILPIVLHPHPSLSTKAAPVETVDDSIRALLDDMVLTAHGANGVGLAANQVDVLKRLIVLDFEVLRDVMSRHEESIEGIPGGILKLVNPEIAVLDETPYLHKGEGCLSIPDVYTEVERPDRIRLTYTDENGKPREYTLHGLAAAAVQHEMDHLNGILFLDRVGKVKRGMLDKKYAKAADYFRNYPRYLILTDDKGVLEQDLSGWKDMDE